MGNVKVSIGELREILEMTPADQNILLTGGHGLGKSEIITAFYTSRGMKVVPLFLSQMADPGDLIGLPDKDAASGKTVFRPPYWFPLDGKPVCLFLDELNRARPEILQCVMDLALNRTLAGRALPEGSVIVSAVNEGEQYQLTDLDPALVSRFNAMHFCPTPAEWLLWARKQGLDERVTSFIESKPEWLDGDPAAAEAEDTGLDKTPDRRAWKRVSDILRDRKELTPALVKAVSGIVGQRAASAFTQCATERRLVSGKGVVLHFDRHRGSLAEYDCAQLNSVSESVFRALEVEKVPESSVKSASDNLNGYFDWLSRERKESAAFFANLYIDSAKHNYSNAAGFIATKCGLLPNSLVIYVKGISGTIQ